MKPKKNWDDKGLYEILKPQIQESLFMQGLSMED